jgi:hypothetical protein
MTRILQQGLAVVGQDSGGTRDWVNMDSGSADKVMEMTYLLSFPLHCQWYRTTPPQG